MASLIDQLVTRATTLTAALRFHHKPNEPSGAKIAPQVVKGALALPEAGTYQEAADYPFVRVAVYRGAFHATSPQPCEAVFWAGIWTPDSYAAGYDDLEALLAALGLVVTNRRFAPYYLSEACPWEIGVQDSGFEAMQRHPFHHGAVRMQFSATQSAIDRAGGAT